MDVSTKRVLITGASGFLGRLFAQNSRTSSSTLPPSLTV
jgi:thioester reductase-like protein